MAACLRDEFKIETLEVCPRQCVYISEVQYMTPGIVSKISSLAHRYREVAASVCKVFEATKIMYWVDDIIEPHHPDQSPFTYPACPVLLKYIIFCINSLHVVHCVELSQSV